MQRTAPRFSGRLVGQDTPRLSLSPLGTPHPSKIWSEVGTWRRLDAVPLDRVNPSIVAAFLGRKALS